MDKSTPGAPKNSTRRKFLAELAGGCAALLGALALRRPAAAAAPAASKTGPIDGIFTPMPARSVKPRAKK